MVARYEIHPMEAKFHQDMADKVKRDLKIEEDFKYAVIEGHTDVKSFFRRGYNLGVIYANAQRPPVFTYEEWLDKPIHPDAPFTNRNLMGPDSHYTGKIVFDSLMREFSK